MDHVAPAKRSSIMAAVHSKNTSAEMAVRRIIHGLGYRYRLHVKTLPGQPDIVFPMRRKIIFVHGCFWHRHKDCKYASVPKSHVEFWSEKFSSNVARDNRVRAELRRMGWKILIVWQCQIKNPERLKEQLDGFLTD